VAQSAAGTALSLTRNSRLETATPLNPVIPEIAQQLSGIQTPGKRKTPFIPQTWMPGQARHDEHIALIQARCVMPDFSLARNWNLSPVPCLLVKFVFQQQPL
jgi:hypothetical protein